MKAQNITVDENSTIEPADSKSETDVMLALTKWSETVNAAFEEHAPHTRYASLYMNFQTHSISSILGNKIVTNQKNEKQRGVIYKT